MGVPRRDVAIGILGLASWWLVGVWLFWGYQPRYDDFYYTLWARWWIEGNVIGLAENWPGTLIRPYAYHLFLGGIGYPVPSLLVSEQTRLVVSAVQIAVFGAASFRLARALGRFSRSLPRAVVGGLLCMPFAVLTNGEVLSESLSLSVAALAVSFSCPNGSSAAERRGNVVGVLLSLAVLAMTRTAHVPIALVASGAILLLLLVDVARSRDRRREVARGLILVGVGLAGWALVVAPQAALMWKHQQAVPDDPTFWGVGSQQLLWSQQIGKYATVVAGCPDAPTVGVLYPAPFADASTASGDFQWYLIHPHVALWHLFQSLNWDFPTTYVSTLNPLVTVPLNAVSLLVAVGGLVTVIHFAPTLVRVLWRDAPSLGVMLGVFAGLWFQTAFTAVETRFGILPWSALSVAAVWGAMLWWDRLRSGIGSWKPVVLVTVTTGILLAISRLAVAGVPAFQQLEAAGCWR